MKKQIALGLLLTFALTGVFAQKKTTSDALFVLDASGSMWQKLDDEYKITIAKTVLQKLVDGLPADTRVGLIAYGHHRKSDCTDIETLLPLSGLDKKSFAEKLGAIHPQGMTPIAKSLEHALTLIEQESAPVTCILISDGLETCEGNACELVRNAKARGMAITVHVIGFGLTESDLSALECIAQAGGGQYLPANNSDELGKAIEKTIEAPVTGGGYLSVYTTLAGKPLDTTVKVFKKGEKKETVFGRTYEGSETNPRVMQLPPGTYRVEVRPIQIDGNPVQSFDDVVVQPKDTTVQLADFAQGLVEVQVRRNGELSDALIVLYQAGTRNAVTQTRSYKTATNNPATFRVPPGVYDVEIKAIEIAGSPLFRIEKQVLKAGATMALQHEFASGELRVGARKGSELVDATISIYSGANKSATASGRTYQSAGSNPKSFTLEPGKYRVELKPAKPAGLSPKSLEVEIKAGGVMEKISEW